MLVMKSVSSSYFPATGVVHKVFLRGSPVSSVFVVVVDK